MLFRLVVFLILSTIVAAPAAAAQTDAALRAGLQSDLNQYLQSRGKPEHISAISLSISIPGAPSNINLTAGTMRYGGGSRITPQTIYQIGSNTKAFTSVALLQLESEEKLSITDTVGKWLPQYPAWKNVTIHRLLDMTSGIPTYDAQQSMLAAYAANPMKFWSTRELVAVVYPRITKTPWLYSNTAYLLSEMIVEKASGQRYADVLRTRFFNDPAIGLRSTYYDQHLLPPAVASRVVSGYFVNSEPDNAGLRPLLGKDVSKLSLSWTHGAGGIVSTPEDVTRWSRALYEGPLLRSKQRAELESLVSQKTGKPIAQTTAREGHGFGLGVGNLYIPSMGRFFFYEGMTLGYRMLYLYDPKSRVVFAVGLNSQPLPSQNRSGQLMQAIYARLKAAGKL